LPDDGGSRTAATVAAFPAETATRLCVGDESLVRQGLHRQPELHVCDQRAKCQVLLPRRIGHCGAQQLSLKYPYLVSFIVLFFDERQF
jgi:hypothetical protein